MQSSMVVMGGDPAKGTEEPYPDGRLLQAAAARTTRGGEVASGIVAASFLLLVGLVGGLVLARTGPG